MVGLRSPPLLLLLACLRGINPSVRGLCARILAYERTSTNVATQHDIELRSHRDDAYPLQYSSVSPMCL